MKIIFFGNTKYSTIVEKKLHETFGLSAVVTIPDRPLGRKKIPTPNPVKQFAIEHTIPVLTFDTLDKKAIEAVKQCGNIDFFVVADYGLFLPTELLAVPEYAPLNVHHSLLPKYRGPSPAPSVILSGEKISGVTIIRMTNRVDAGPIIEQKKYTLSTNETTDSLLSHLNKIGAELLLPVFEAYKKGTVKEISQDEKKAIFTKHIEKKDGYIDLSIPPTKEMIDRMIRAYYPWPSVWSKVRIRNKELGIKFLPEKKIQIEGKRPMSYKDFFNGYPELRSILIPLPVAFGLARQ